MSELPEVETAAAEAVRRLGNGLLSRKVNPSLAAEITATLDALADRVDLEQRRTKAEAFAAYPGHDRIGHFVDTGRWPDPPPDKHEVTFDALSFVGGRLNPFNATARFYRDGDVAIARAAFGPCYEGPPDRVHGGMIAAAFDEVMGAVFRVRSMASSFTGTLTVRYLKPAPLDTELEFRGWLTSTAGRKHHVEATATGPRGTIASADGTFIEMTKEQFAAVIADHRG